MADNIKQVKFKLTGDNTELLVAWAKTRGAFNQLSEDLSATSKKFEELSEVEKRHFVKSQELALAEVELRRRIAIATKEIGEISERTSNLVTNGILKNKDAYKLLQDSARGYFEYVNAQATKIQQLTPSTLGATSTKEGTAPSVARPPSNPNVYFDFAKNKVVNLKEKLAEEENAIKKSNQQKLESIKAYENHVASQEKETLERRKKFLDELDFQGTANLNKQKLDYQNTWNSLLKNEEEVQKKRQAFVEEFQQRQIQRNKELLDRQKFDEEASLNSRRVAQTNLFNELLNKEEAQKKALTLAAQTKQQQELAATKIQEENIRKQVAAFQRKLSEEEAALKHSLRVQLQEHLTGIHSIEVARINSIEKIRQLEERRSRLTNINASRVQAGIITPEVGRTRQQTINNAFVPAIHAANVALAEQNRLITENAEKHKTLHLAVRNIIASYAVFVSLQNTVVAALQKFIDVGVQLESVRASLTATLGTLDNPENFAKTGNMLAALDAEAERTGIHIGTLRSTFSGLQASMSLAGESLATTNRVFGNLDTVITALHLPAEKAQGIFNALAQIFNKSKVQSEELVKQLGNLIPGAFASFAAANKTSTQQLAKDMKNGLVFAHDTVANFTDFLATRFSAAFEIANQGLNSQIGRMQTSFTHLSETIYGLSSGALVSGVKGLTSFANFLNEVVKGETLAAKNTQTLVDVIEAGLLVATFNAARGMLALKLGVEGLSIAAGAAIIKNNALKASLAFLTAPGTILTGLIAIGLQLKGFRDDADAAEEGLKKVHEKWQLLLGTGNKVTKETQFKFDIENDQGVKEQRQYLAGVIQELENLEKNSGERNFLRAKEIAEKKKLIAEGELDLAREIKRASDELKQKEQTDEHARLEAREKDLSDAKQLELSFLKDEKSAREKALSDFEESHAASISRLKAANLAIIKNSVPFVNASKVGLTEKEQEEYKQNLTALNQYQAGALSVQEQASESFRQKQLQEDDKAAQALINLEKKKFAALERQSKTFYDSELERISNLGNLLSLNQENPVTAIGESTLLNQRLQLLEEEHQLNLQKIASQQEYNLLQKESINDTAKQVKISSDQVKNIIAIINQLETGGVKGNKARAISPTAALGLQQVQPSTLASYGINVPSDILDLEKKGKSTGRLPGGRYKQVSQIFTQEEQTRLRDYAESIQSTLQEVQAQIVQSDLEYFKGNERLTIAAYNAGRGGATQAKLPPETERYLKNIPKAERSVISEGFESAADTAQNELDIQKENNSYLLKKKELSQSYILAQKEVGNEILQQLILQKQSSGELVEAAKLQDILDNGDKRILLSKEEQDSSLAEQNKRLLDLINSGAERNRQEARLNELLAAQSAEYTKIQARIDFRNSLVNQGLETPFGALVGNASDAESAAKIQEQNLPGIIEGIRKLREQGTITPAQEIEQITEQQRKLFDLQTQAQAVESYFRTNLASAFESPFKNIIEGKTNAIGALKEFGVAMLSLIEELIVKELALAAAKAAVSAASSGFSILGGLFSQGGEVGTQTSGVSYSMFSGAFAKGGQVLNFPTGGLVKGPGTETSDSIKAVVPKGSYVIKASSVPAFDKAAATLINVSKNEKILPPNVVQLFGKEKLDQINTSGKFATGGFVGTNIPASPTNSGVANTQGMSYTNHYSIQINIPEGKMSREEAKQTGNDIAVAMMQKIAKVEAAKQISIYDKTRSMSNRKG